MLIRCRLESCRLSTPASSLPHKSKTRTYTVKINVKDHKDYILKFRDNIHFLSDPLNPYYNITNERDVRKNKNRYPVDVPAQIEVYTTLLSYTPL